MTPITFLVIGCLFHYVITGCAEVTGLTLKTCFTTAFPSLLFKIFHLEIEHFSRTNYEFLRKNSSCLLFLYFGFQKSPKFPSNQRLNSLDSTLSRNCCLTKNKLSDCEFCIYLIFNILSEQMITYQQISPPHAMILTVSPLSCFLDFLNFLFQL